MLPPAWWAINCAPVAHPQAPLHLPRYSFQGRVQAAGPALSRGSEKNQPLDLLLYGLEFWLKGFRKIRLAPAPGGRSAGVLGVRNLRQLDLIWVYAKLTV